MQKYIPLSLIVFSIFFPAFVAGRSRGRKSMRLVFIVMAIYIVVWAWMCLNVYPVYVHIE
jgi:hypothetical protein